ncbi:MAG: transcriptional regulator GcvA [Hyphomicrobiales bacterium]
MTRKLPSLNAMRAFEAAARHMSFTGAAEELFVTHAAISRHIRELEDWLGVQLFVRTGRGVTPTEAGHAYREQLTPAFDRMARATQDIMRPAGDGQLTVSVEEAFASRWLVPHMGRFTKANPDIELSIDPEDALVDFHGRAIDLAIRYGHGGWPDVEAELLVEARLFPVCSPDLVDGKTLTSPAELADYPLLHEDSRRWWEHWLRTEGVADEVGSKGPMFQGHLALEAAEAGQGFALGDQVLTAEALAEGWLIKPFPGVRPYGAYYLVGPPEKDESDAVERFRSWIRTEMAETETWFNDAYVS